MLLFYYLRSLRYDYYFGKRATSVENIFYNLIKYIFIRNRYQPTLLRDSGGEKINK